MDIKPDKERVIAPNTSPPRSMASQDLEGSDAASPRTIRPSIKRTEIASEPILTREHRLARGSPTQPSSHGHEDNGQGSGVSAGATSTSEDERTGYPHNSGVTGAAGTFGTSGSAGPLGSTGAGGSAGPFVAATLSRQISSMGPPNSSALPQTETQSGSNSSSQTTPTGATAQSSQLAQINTSTQPQNSTGQLNAPPSSRSNMIVETETVPSVPTLAVATAGGSSLKLKRSQDSVPRPHNTHRGGASTSGRKRSLRLGQGSKADIFAAKVASAVDEANSSDSDETFVYDTHSREPRRLVGQQQGSGSISGDTQRDSSRESRRRLMLDDDDYGLLNDYRMGGGIIGGLSSSEGHPILLGPREVARELPPSLRRPYSRTTSNSSIGMGPMGPMGTIGPTGANNLLSGHSARSSDPNNPLQNPSPRPFVAYDPRKKDSQRAKNTYLQRWRTAPGASGATDDEDEDDSQAVRFGRSLGSQNANERQPLYNGSPRHPRYMGSFDGSNNPHDFSPKAYSTPLVVRITLWMVSLLIGILAVLFLVGLVIVASRPLTDLNVLSLDDVLTSDKELVFSLILRGKNPGLFSVVIDRADIDVFATSGFVKLPGEDDDDKDGDKKDGKHKGEKDPPSAPRTFLLGNIHELESPVSFSGSFFHPKADFETVPVKLINPAINGSADASNWQNIIEHPFDLTIKGTLRYSLFLNTDYRVSVSGAIPVTPPLP